MNKRTIINFIKSVPRQLNDLINYNARCNCGHADLIKGYKNSKSISKEQKVEIETFWKPYLKTYKEKYAFDIRWFDMYI